MTRFFTQHRTSIITVLLGVASLGLVLGTYDTVSANHEDRDGNKIPHSAQAGQVAPTNPNQTNIGPMAMVGTFIGNFILYIGSSITWIGGMILNMCIQYFILDTNGIIGNGTPVGTAITVVWTLIRDICNLAFIAGFIYVGIKTIIDADSASTKKMLASIIIAAFLINFSLLIARLVIDVGNIVAVALYNNIANGQNISVKFGEILGVTSLYDVTNPATQQAMAAASAGGNIAFYFMATIMLIVAGFVLAAGGILLMIRFVALIFILCFSPILFAATIFPATAGTAKKLWGYLINYTLFAPAYLLMLFVSIYLLDSVVYALRGNNAISDAINAGQSGAFGAVLAFGIAIFFLVMSLQISRNFGIVGAEKTLAFGTQLRGYGQRALGGATFGAGAALSRATAGRLGNRVSDSNRLKDVASQRGFKGWAARQTLKGSRVAADASFDARKVGGMGGKLGIGEGAKGGYQTQLKDVKKKEEEFARSLGEVDDTDVRVIARKREQQASEKRKRDLEEELRVIPNDADHLAERQRKREQIEEQNKKIEESKNLYEREKQRRQIGSTYAKPSDPVATQALKAEIGRDKDALKDRWVAYAALDDAMKENQRPIIQAMMDSIKKKEESHAKMLRENDGGYAGVLEKENLFTSWPVGRSAWDNRKAGKDVRKNAEKGLPKKKDE